MLICGFSRPLRKAARGCPQLGPVFLKMVLLGVMEVSSRWRPQTKAHCGGPLYVDYDEFPNCGGISFEGPVSDSTKAPVSGPLVGWLAYAKERRSEEERKRRSEEAKRITSEDVRRRGGEE